MTEIQWLESTDPFPMLAFLRGKVSERKLRLFACACCRRILATRASTEGAFQHALANAESLAEGKISQQDALSARSILEGDFENWSAYCAVSATLDPHADLAAECAAHHSVDYFGYTKKEHRSFLARILGSRQAPSRKPLFLPAPILRDIFGNPFRFIYLSPAWLDADVQRLAATIYEERAFEQMSSLGHALEEFGCTDANILNHCRQPGEHARGCWVVDLILAKS